ncbi:uncharacterized protein TNCV_1766091 [Trichonephila clavipes]|nr:uncharacterized protein TNCV_1766091 [Trichonephila clavipes]
MPLHNGNEVDDWMGLDEWNSWLNPKSETRTGAKSVSKKELEFPAVTVCGRYLISRTNAKEAKLQYMEDLYTFLHSIPSKNVSNQVKSRCYEDPLCAWKRFKEKCVCYQNPCDTHQCDGNQHGPWCNCSKLLCDWDTTRGYGACQLVQNKQDEFCSCRRDFEYPSYNPNDSNPTIVTRNPVALEIDDVTRQ